MSTSSKYKVTQSKIADTFILEFDKGYNDNRGNIRSLYNDSEYNKALTPFATFVEDKISVSHRHTLRGFHAEKNHGKLISCVNGTIDLRLIDLRKKSPTFLQRETYVINGQDNLWIWLPPGVANAHYCFGSDTIFYYKLVAPYRQEDQVSLYAPDLYENYTNKKFIMSERDLKAPKLYEYEQGIVDCL